MATLRNELSGFQMFCLGFGTIVGAGWILLMGPWLAEAGSVGAMIAFAVAGIAILVIAICYAELCGLYPVAGGEVAYHLEAYGLSASFLTGWFIALAYIAGVAYEAIAVAWIFTELLPQLEGPKLYAFLGTDVHAGALAIGVAFMFVIGTLNHRGARIATLAQDWVTMAFVAFSAAFIVFSCVRGDYINLGPLFAGDSVNSAFAGLLSVLAVTPFFYVGFNVIAQALGERSSTLGPRTVAMALIGSVLGAAVFYILVIFATAVSLPRDELLASTLPVGEAFAVAFDSTGFAKLALIVALLGLLTTWNALYFAAGRVLLAFGRANLLTAPFAFVSNKSGTPTVALAFVGIVGALGSLFGQGIIVPIFNAMSGAMCIVFLFACCAVVRLRAIRPDAPRAYRLPGGRILPVFGAALAAVLAFVAFRQAFVSSQTVVVPEFAILLLWLCLGGVFWIASRKRRAQQSAKERRFALEL